MSTPQANGVLRDDQAPPSPLGVRKGDAAYHAVRRAILLGQLRPGESLMEQKIAGELRCSQGTVREALLRLEQDGLVSRRGYRGTVVSTTSIEEAIEMARIRIRIECVALRASVARLRPELLDALEQITAEMDAAKDSGDYYLCSELDRRFHLTLYRESGLPALEPILTRCALHIHRFTYDNPDSKAFDRDLGDRHRQLVEVLRRGDVETAERAVTDHIAEVLAVWAPALSPALDPAIDDAVGLRL